MTNLDRYLTSIRQVSDWVPNNINTEITLGTMLLKYEAWKSFQASCHH